MPALRPHLSLATALLAASLLWLPALWQPAQHLDFLWLDALTRAQARQQAGDSDIVLVDIDDYSLQALAGSLGRWPWPRATHAELVEWLQAQGVRSVVFDIWFSEPDIQRPEFDQYFGEVLDRADNVFLPTLALNSEHPIRKLAAYPGNLPIARGADADENAALDLLLPAMGTPERWRLGLVNYLADADGIARHYALLREQQGWQLSSLPLVVAASQGSDTHNLPQPLRLRWTGNGSDAPYTHHSYADLWLAVQQGQALPALAGKTVFIGATAAGLHDLRPTPLNPQYPGLYLLANTFDNVKNRQWLHWASWYGPLAGSLLLLWLYRQLKRQQALARTALEWLASCALLVAASALAIQRDYLLPMVSPVLASGLLLAAGTAQHYLRERAARQAAIELFGRFLDPVVVGQLAEQGLTDSTRASRQCEISVLFSDIRGFTSMSEKATAAEIMALLNAYFSRQVGVIFRHRGTLDKFIGDAIMAFWGAPLPDAQHAVHAVAAALDMIDELEAFCRERKLDGFDIGIGIHSGPAVVGMLGCEQRLEYTAIGDTVNLGSRLEGVTKGIARLLVSQQTRDLCGEHFDFIAHGSCQVKGRAEAVQLYEPRRKVAAPGDKPQAHATHRQSRVESPAAR